MDKIGWGFFFWSQEFFSRVKNLLFRVENFYLESRIFSSSRDCFPRVQIFLPDREFFHRVENTQHAMSSFAAKMIKQYGGLRSVGYEAFLYNVFVLQVAEGLAVEDLERFLLSIQDCISHIEHCTTSGNDRNMLYIYTIAWKALLK